MGYQPRSPYYEMYLHAEKEAKQLRYANDELVAEVHRLRQDGRLAIEANSAEQLARDLETAEDALWKAQDKLKLEKSYTWGFATIGVLSSPATVALLLWISGTENGLLTAFGITFGIVFGAASLIGLSATIAKIFGAIPEAKREVAQKQRHLDRLTLKELGL